MHQQDLAEHQLPHGADLDELEEAALERRGGLRDARVLHARAGRLGEAGLRELAFLLGELVARYVHRVGGRLVDQVDHELARAADVLERMLHGPVGARIDADHAQRWLLREHVEEGEGRAVGDAVRAARRNPCDRPGNDQADEQLVALQRRQFAQHQVHRPQDKYNRRAYPRMVHMLATALSKRLKLKTPIFQAPMAGVTTPELVLAVGKAGALGGFGAAYTEPAALKDAVGKVRAAAPDLPIHINLFVEAPPPEPSAQELRAAAAALAPAFESLKVKIPEKLPPPYCPDLSAQIENALALRPAVLSSHFNPFAPEVIKEARKLGILIAGSATTLEEAQRQEALGVDL